MIFYLVLSFILGSAIGSFLNVVIDRTTRGETLLGRSYCDHCKASLSTIDLIPIVSFVSFGARCRYCKKPISWQYPIVEAATGTLFLIGALSLISGADFGLIRLLYFFFIISIVIVVSAIDMKFSLIPTTLVFFASLVVLTYNYFTFSPNWFLEQVISAFIAALFFLFLVVITRRRGMGEGDVVLAFLIGLVLGYEKTILAIFLSFFTGALVSLILIVFGKKKFGQTVPFAPFLVLGLLCAMFWGDVIVRWYMMVY